MKTIQQIIKETNHKEIEREYFYEYSPKLHELRDDDDCTVAEIMQCASERFQDFLTRVCEIEIEPDPDGQHILFATKHIDKYGFDKYSAELVSVEELLEAEDLSNVQLYAIEYTEWKYALGFLVADNRMTQDNLMDVIVEFLYSISFSGYYPEAVENAIKELEARKREAEEHPERLKEISDVEWNAKYDKPREVVDEKEEELKAAISAAKGAYYEHIKVTELQRIKEELIAEG